MKNFQKRLASFSLGLVLTLGVGVCLNGPHQESVGVHAATTESNTFADAGTYDDTAKTITWKTANENITMVQNQGETTSTAPGSSNLTNGRLYMGNFLTFSALNEYKIHKIEITYTSSYFGNSMTAGVTLDAEGTTVTDDTTALNRTWDTSTSGGTHIVGATAAEGLSTIYIQSTYKKDGKQLRWNSGGIKVTYTKPAATGDITGVEINGSSSATTATVNEGYLGRKTLQLTGVATQSGSGLDTSVTWSSADSEKMSVDETGLVTILANDTVRITATSVETTTFSNYIDVTATGLLAYEGAKTSTNFDTTDMGEEKIVSTEKGTPVDIYGKLTVAKLTVDKAESSNQPGFYTNDPVSVRVYGGATMTVSVPSSYKLYWIDLTSISGNELSTSNTTLSAGKLSVKGLSSVVDCTKLDVNEVVFTMSAQVRFTAISISYSYNTATEDAIEYATYFLDKTATICADEGASDHKTALEAIWSDLETEYGKLSEDAQKIVKEATSKNENEKLAKFAGQYDHIVTRYGLTDFVKGTTSTSGAHAALASADNSLTITIIVLVSVLSVSLIAGTSLIVRKRKAN